MKFKNQLVLIALVICFSSFQSFACLNPIGESQVGQRIQVDGIAVNEFVKSFVTHKDRTYWEKIRDDIEARRKNHPFLESRNNLAVALIHLGQIQEAIKILEALEKDSPSKYFTAVNLGTAYELNGENHKALEWIKEGIKRNKDSHFGTEWLHVQILEAKLAMEKDAGWLKNNSVLGIDFSNALQTQSPKIYLTDSLGQQRSLAQIEDALVYQLHERLEFVKAPEPIVADLLSDLSKVFAISRTPEHAKAINEIAVNYGAKPKEIVATGNPEQNKNIGNNEPNYYIYYVVTAISVLVLIGIIYVFLRKRSLR